MRRSGWCDGIQIASVTGVCGEITILDDSRARRYPCMRKTGVNELLNVNVLQMTRCGITYGRFERPIGFSLQDLQLSFGLRMSSFTEFEYKPRPRHR